MKGKQATEVIDQMFSFFALLIFKKIPAASISWTFKKPKYNTYVENIENVSVQLSDLSPKDYLYKCQSGQKMEIDST